MNGSDHNDHSLFANGSADTNSATIDSAARGLGLKSVRAYVPDPQVKRRSSGAERAQRHRERKERDGMKQISVTLPTDLHPVVQEFAKRMRAGEPVESALRDVFRVPSVTTPAAPTAPTTHTAPTATRVPDAPVFDAKLQSLLSNLPAWRRWLLRRLLPPQASL